MDLLGELVALDANFIILLLVDELAKHQELEKRIDVPFFPHPFHVVDRIDGFAPVVRVLFAQHFDFDD